MADEENNVEEQEIAIETEEQEQPQEEKAAVASGDEELDSYSKGVQSRIKKLTEKYRQEERDKAEALRVSQQLLAENQKLKTRMQALDTGYLSEYGTRLQSQTEAAKRVYKEAYEAGDTDRMLEAQQALSNIAVETQRYNTAKARAEQQAKVQVQRQEQPVQQQQQQPVQQQQQVDPRAQEWASKNDWFGQDKVMTAAAFALHSQLTEEEGFDPQSDEYYTEVDKRIRSEFPHKFQTAKKSGGGSQVASAGNSASRSNKQGRRSVKLTHSQVAIAKKLGVPLEEYAKYVKE
jgi:fused signal recognition particle receptor